VLTERQEGGKVQGGGGRKGRSQTKKGRVSHSRWGRTTNLGGGGKKMNSARSKEILRESKGGAFAKGGRFGKKKRMTRARGKNGMRFGNNRGKGPELPFVVGGGGDRRSRKSFSLGGGGGTEKKKRNDKRMKERAWGRKGGNKRAQGNGTGEKEYKEGKRDTPK